VSGVDFENDEAVWAAYRRSDKAAVTEELFLRCLGRVTRLQSGVPSLITKSRLTRSCVARLGDAGPTHREKHS